MVRTGRGVRKVAAALAGAVLGLAGSRAEAAALYQVTDLGNLDVRGISNAGQVIGEQTYTTTWQDRWDLQPRTSTDHRSVIVQGGTITPVKVPGSDEVVRDAVISPGGTIAYSGGQHVDYVTTGPTAHVIRDGKVTDAGTATDGGLVGGAPYSIPHAVTDGGIVAGESHAINRWNRAFASMPKPDGTYTPTGLGANGGTQSRALGVNDAGQVVGYTDVAGHWQYHAFIGGGTVYSNHGWVDDIGTLGGGNSYATAINNKGQVVGYSDIGTGGKTADSSQSYNSREPTHAFLYQGGVMRDLGTLPGFANSFALAINSLGQVVGGAGPSGIGAPATSWAGLASGPGHAFLYQDGVMTDLNDLLPKGSPWRLENAIAINDLGQIVGEGEVNGVVHAFLLTPEPAPVPEPGTLGLFGALAAALVARERARRRRCRAARANPTAR